MNHPARLSTEELNRLHDEAHARAAALRSAAFDSLWTATWRWFTQAQRKPAPVQASRKAGAPEALTCAS